MFATYLLANGKAAHALQRQLFGHLLKHCLFLVFLINCFKNGYAKQ